MGFGKTAAGSFTEQYCLEEIEATRSGKYIVEGGGGISQSGKKESEQEQENSTSIFIPLIYELLHVPGEKGKQHCMSRRERGEIGD